MILGMSYLMYIYIELLCHYCGDIVAHKTCRVFKSNTLWETWYSMVMLLVLFFVYSGIQSQHNNCSVGS